MLVKDVMTRNPFTTTPETSVPEAKSLMSKQRVNKLPVVDKSGSLIGIVTSNDLVKAAPSDATTLDMFELSYLLGKLKVEKIMHKDVKFVSENETIENAARIMDDYKIGCLPVMKDKLLVGIVTDSDLFRVFIDLFDTKTPGVRATLILDEKPGQLAKVTTGVAEIGGNIVSLLTSDAADDAHRTITLKAGGVTIDQMKDIIAGCGGELQDIRNV